MPNSVTLYSCRKPLTESQISKYLNPFFSSQIAEVYTHHSVNIHFGTGYMSLNAPEFLLAMPIANIRKVLKLMFDNRRFNYEKNREAYRQMIESISELEPTLHSLWKGYEDIYKAEKCDIDYFKRIPGAEYKAINREKPQTLSVMREYNKRYENKIATFKRQYEKIGKIKEVLKEFNEKYPNLFK